MGSGQSLGSLERRCIEEFNDDTNNFIHMYLNKCQLVTGISSESAWNSTYPMFYDKYRSMLHVIESFHTDNQRDIYNHLLKHNLISVNYEKIILDEWIDNNILDLLNNRIEEIDLRSMSYCICGSSKVLLISSKGCRSTGLYKILN